MSDRLTTMCSFFGVCERFSSHQLVGLRHMYKQEPPPTCFQTRASETYHIRVWVSPLVRLF